MLCPKKNSNKEFDNKKNSCGSKIPHPSPITFLMVRPLLSIIGNRQLSKTGYVTYQIYRKLKRHRMNSALKGGIILRTVFRPL